MEVQRLYTRLILIWLCLSLSAAVKWISTTSTALAHPNWVACDQKMFPFLPVGHHLVLPRWVFFRKMYHANIITDFYGETEQLHALPSVRGGTAAVAGFTTMPRLKAATTCCSEKAITNLWIGKLLRQLYWKIYCILGFLFLSLSLFTTGVSS